MLPRDRHSLDERNELRSESNDNTTHNEDEEGLLGDGDRDDSDEPTRTTHGARLSQQVAYTPPVSRLSDEALDDVIRGIRVSFPLAGLAMLDGALRSLGHRVPRARVAAALLRIDPIRRTFDRQRIERRVYSVAGPNALWHHDGQHGE